MLGAVTIFTCLLPAASLHQRMMQRRLLQYFDQGASPFGHNETDFERWLSCKDQRCPAYEITPASERFEPWGVLDRQQALEKAPYDEVYRGYGELRSLVPQAVGAVHVLVSANRHAAGGRGVVLAQACTAVHTVSVGPATYSNMTSAFGEWGDWSWSELSRGKVLGAQQELRSALHNALYDGVHRGYDESACTSTLSTCSDGSRWCCWPPAHQMVVAAVEYAALQVRVSWMHSFVGWDSCHV
jgi:hypothetical protein